MTDAHEQEVTHHYTMHYPEHEPREHDPHYHDFEAYRRRTKATAVCAIGEWRKDFSGCRGPLELHHAHIEFALQNAVDLAVLEAHYPGVSNPDEVGEWVESAANLEWLCQFHHRGHGGVHVASSSDFEAQKFIEGLIS
ncbi:hypothetical protein DQP57_00215 [Mycobacterium colombiense]|uniref:Uncharacterized protein n=1 Tax=Mycobacterium colombiense TaxID=339268 RepID=A0A329ME00_9MYCO|nr:hypothetical protein [Mycobacterium colombiense]RAV17486.1 hypothetical protein DQP57_00215 [Mycobacterium colombiense]